MQIRIRFSNDACDSICLFSAVSQKLIDVKNTKKKTLALSRDSPH